MTVTSRLRMSSYTKEIQEIVKQKFRPVNDHLILRADEFINDDTRSSIGDDEDYNPSSRQKKCTSRDPEEIRLLKLLETSESTIKQQIINSLHPDMIKANCLQMLREYNDDPENNSTSLTAVQLILKLPTIYKPLPITINNTYEQTTAFLEHVWSHMQSRVYGQEQAKSEIIEYLVSKLLAPATAAPRILGLVGAPGVGKTSLAIHGIAEVMGVPFHHVSVGGLRDVTYFSGSMRCWKGSHQGKFTDIMIQNGCLNPIIYVDELDKVAGDTAQDIYGLLTHVADPITNSRIHDNYLGIDLDLSRVTFIFSYNDSSVLPAPLRDRIKEIHFSSFNHEQKVDIARDFIIPASLKEYGLSSKDIDFSSDVIAYTNKTLQSMSAISEMSGVRYLNKGYQSLIGKIMVNVICNRDSYMTLQSHTTGTDKRKKTKLKSAPCSASAMRFMPYYKPVKLPYRLKIPDINYYLSPQ